MRTRPLDDGDALLLRLATWWNLNWSGARFTVAQMDADPHLAAYYRATPEFGFVSTTGDGPTGVVCSNKREQVPVPCHDPARADPCATLDAAAPTRRLTRPDRAPNGLASHHRRVCGGLSAHTLRARHGARR